MNHDFDEELRGAAERRSRRNPRLREEPEQPDAVRRQSGELNVMGDTAINPLPQTDRTQNRQTAERPMGQAANRAARQTAASRPGGGGLPPHVEERLTKRKRRRRIITMIVAECFALLFIFTYAAFARKYNLVQNPPFNEENVMNPGLDINTEERMKGYWTIAVFGVDSRGKAIAEGTNADVNLICNINLDTGEIKLVSVFRDAYLNISEKGSYNKINQAYFLGGPEQAVAALNRNLDLNMTSYMTFNWRAVAEGINILGGVDIELSKAEFYYINSFITETVKATGIGSNHLKKAGMNHLDGVQAVAYGRLRLMDTDYARTERQRKVIAQAFEKAKTAKLSTLNTLIGAVFPQVATNIGVDDLVKNASILSKFYMGESTGFPQARGDANMGKKGAVVVPQTLESNVVALHKFLFDVDDYTPSDTVKRLSAKIAEDTGMYREGKYIDNVGTGGGVIQPPKTTAAATKAADEDDEEDEEEDEETTEELTESEDSTRTSEVETDEDGNPVEVQTVRPGDPTESRPSRPGDPTESRPSRPGDPAESRPSRPGDPAESRPSRPGDPTESSPSRPTRPSRPGDDSPSSPTRPDTPSESTVSRPGSDTTSPTPGGGPAASSPDTEVPTSAIPQFPGGSPDDGNTPGGNNGPSGPSGQGAAESNSAPVGTISAPGQ